MLTKIRDIDLKILQQLEDHELPAVCQTNKYVASLCNDESFWLNRLLLKKNLKLELINKLKENLTYKDLYRYLFFEKVEGLHKAIRSNNLQLFRYLFKSTPLSGDDLMYVYMITMQLDNVNRSKDIILYLFLNDKNTDEYNKKRNVSLSADPEMAEWLDNFELLDPSDYIENLMLHDDDPDFKYGVDINEILSEIQKYIHRVPREHDIFFREHLIDYLDEGSIEGRIKIAQLLIQNGLFDIQRAIKYLNNSRFINTDEGKQFLRFLNSQTTKT